MPGLVVFRRRWAVASDDFVLPSLILLLVHLTWLLIMTLVLAAVESRDWRAPCMAELHEHFVGYIVILVGCVLVEGFMLRTSMRGAVMQTEARKGLEKLIYIRSGLLAVEMVWLILGVIWIRRHHSVCLTSSASYAKDAALGITITNWIVMLAIFITITCSFDCSGISFPEQRERYKKRGRRRSEVEGNWGKRCQLLVCCLNNADRHHGSLAEVITMLSNFFEDMDLVPSDIIAGLVILRKLQQMHRRFIVENERNQVCDFLSGVRVTASTQFLDVNNDDEITLIQDLIHYMRYSLTSYGWPVAVMNRSRACFDLCPFLHCRCCPGDRISVRGDNACHCNEAAFRSFFESNDCELLFAKYNVQITEPSFFIAIDYEKQAIVIVIRGTMSLEDMITDLNLTADVLPLNACQRDWLGHKGMIQAAEYIRNQLLDGGLLRQAFMHATDRGSESFSLVLVGHSLGAGTASILAMLLRPQYPDLHCYAFAPPGLLSLPAAIFSRSFITSVVLGKDVVPRLGLYQMKFMQQDILAALQFSTDPKWKVIGLACCPPPSSKDAEEEQICQAVEFWRKRSRVSGEDVACGSLLVPPGKIMHIVRSHPEQHPDQRQAVHQALWSENQDFQEILISPVMVQDHLPHNLLTALQSLLQRTGPPKPERLPSFVDTTAYSYVEPIYTSIAPLPTISCGRTDTPDSLDTLFTQKLGSERLVMETSFTDLRPSSLAEESEYGRSCISGKPSFLSALRHHKKMDLFRHDWIRSAPLASPETLSLSSVPPGDSRPPDPRRVRCDQNRSSGLPVHRSSSQISMQDLIDVFSECSDTRSLEEMVQDAKRAVAAECDVQQLSRQILTTSSAQDVSLLF